MYIGDYVYSRSYMQVIAALYMHLYEVLNGYRVSIESEVYVVDRTCIQEVLQG